MKTQATGEIRLNSARIEQQQAITQPLHQVFAKLAFSYGMTIQEAERGELTGSALVCLEMACDDLKALIIPARAELREVRNEQI